MWQYFSYETDPMLACPCCDAREMDSDFMLIQDMARGAVGFPLTVSSGYRCPHYNGSISSTGPDGPHTTGKAIDYAISGGKALKLVWALTGIEEVTGIGLNQKGPHNKRFIHNDTLTTNPRPWIWTY